MFDPRLQRQQQFQNPQMRSQAAQMAAQQLDDEDQRPPKAPIVPTTNMRMPNMTRPNFTVKAPQQMQPVQPTAPTLNPAAMRPNPNIPIQAAPAPMPTRSKVVRERGHDGTVRGTTVGQTTPVQPPMLGTDEGDQWGTPIADPAPQPASDGDGETEDLRSRGQMFDDAMKELMGKGPRNTKGEEELLREQMRRDVGAGQAGLNARMAAGGGGTSGALGALTTDMRSRAALDAAQGIETIRENARTENFDRIKAGMGAFTDDRATEADRARNDMIMEYIKNQMGGAGADGDGIYRGDLPTEPPKPASVGRHAKWDERKMKWVDGETEWMADGTPSKMTQVGGD